MPKLSCTKPGCIKTFGMDKDLKRHMLIHAGVRYSAPCGYSLSRRDIVKRHVDNCKLQPCREARDRKQGDEAKTTNALS